MAPAWPRHPTVYEINTWIWLDALSRTAGRRTTLAEVPDEVLAPPSSR